MRPQNSDFEFPIFAIIPTLGALHEKLIRYPSNVSQHRNRYLAGMANEAGTAIARFNA
jgi:hypothetical protein